MFENLKKKLSGFFDIPSLDLSPEQEDKFIERWAQTISRWRMEDPALMFLGGAAPVAPVISQLTVLPYVPIMELFGIQGYDYVAFFNKTENVRRLLNRIEELRDSKR